MGQTSSIVAGLRADGFTIVHAAAMRALLPMISDGGWARFAATWGDLALDTYLLEKGLRRGRRHAVFLVSPGSQVEREPHQPHYQGREYNPLQGGIERWFEPITAGDGVLRSILEVCAPVFEATVGPAPFRVEAHQFRIEAGAEGAGQPTPEGVHRDGVDGVVVLLVARVNVASGTTSIYDVDGHLRGAFTLRDAFDAVFVDDRRMAHGVTPIVPLDASRPAYRDVLVVTFKRATG